MDALARAVEEDDVELAAIAIARLEDASVRAAEVRARLDALAGTVADRLGVRTGSRRMRALVRAVHRELGFFAPDDYGDPELHRIDRVLERRAGSPVALAVVLIALGRRVGVALEPVAFPGHFLVRAIGPTPVLIEPCTGAMPIPEDALFEMAARELGLTRTDVEVHLGRAAARAIAARLLENLQRVYRERGERARALALEEHLVALGGPEARAARAMAGLVRGMRSAPAPPRVLAVHPRALSFRVGDGPPVDLRRRRALPLLLARLVEHHRAGATHGLGWPALIEAGWPGEKIQPDAAWARLRTAIRTLRRLGLADALITIGSGYLLDPSWTVRWDPDER